MAAAGKGSDDHIGAGTSAPFRKARETFARARGNADAICGMDPDDALEHEQVLFSKLAKKINKRGKAQPRALVVTTLAIYNLKPGVLARWQRRIGLHELEELVACPGSSGAFKLLLHMWPASEEYDYLLLFESAADRAAASSAISSGFRALVGRPLSELTLDEKELSNRRVLKTTAQQRAKAAQEDSKRAKASRLSVVRSNITARKSISAPAADAAKPPSPAAAEAGAGSSSPAAGAADAAAPEGGSALTAGRLLAGLAGLNDRAAWDQRAAALSDVALSCVDAVTADAREADSRALPAVKVAEDTYGRSTELGAARFVAEALLNPQESSAVHRSLGSMEDRAAALMEAAAAMAARPFRPRPVLPSESEVAGEDEDGEYEDEDGEDGEGGGGSAGAGAGGPSLEPVPGHDEAGEARGWWVRVMWDLHTRAMESGGDEQSGRRGRGAEARGRFRSAAEAVGRFHEALPALLAGPFPASIPFVVSVRAELARRAGISGGKRDEAKGYSSRSAGAAPGTPASAALLEAAASHPWVASALGEEGAHAAVVSAADRVSSVPGSRMGHAFVPLEEGVYLALLEIMMGQLHRPGDRDRGAETFGQVVRQSQMVSLVARLMPLAPTWAVRLQVVTDLNTLLVRKDDNFARVMSGGDWPAWLPLMLAAVPKREEDRDGRVKDYNKLVMNLFAMMLYHVAAKGGDDIEEAVNRVFAQLRRQCGSWSLDVTAVARSVLNNLLVKIGSEAKKWRKDKTQPQWMGLFAVARVVEDFCFYRPEEAEQSGDTVRVATAMAEVAEITKRRRAREAPPKAVVADANTGKASDAGAEASLEWRAHGSVALSKEGAVVPGLLPLLPEYVSPAAVIPLATGADGKVDRGAPGVHLAEADGQPTDLKLAKRTLKLLTKLGLKPKKDAAAASSRSEKKEVREVNRHGAGLVAAFESIVEFFEGVAAKGTCDTAQLAAFLEKRQREQSTGFFSRGAASRKQLAAQLDASLMRQQAQREVRKQLKAQIDRIGDAVEVEGDADIDEEALAAARKSRRKRKRKAPTSAAGGSAASGGAAASAASAAGADAEAIEQETAEEDLKTSALRASMGAVEGSGADGDEDDGETVTDAESAVEELDADEDELSGTSCPVCDEGLEGRDTTAVPGYGTCHLECVACSECSRHLAVEGDPGADDVALRTGGVAMCLGGKLLCRTHFLDKFSTSICAGCLVPFRKGERAVDAAGRRWHPEHLACESCGGPFVDGKCYGVSGLPYCSTCHVDLFLRCNGCGEAVEDAEDGINALGKTWHRRCFACTDCGGAFDEGRFYSRDGRPYCETHYFENFAPKCARCSRPVVNDGLRACGAVWHSECFGCAVCSEPFDGGKFFEKDGQAFCEEHYLDRFGQRCGGCGLVIKDKYMQALDQSWHPECFVCAECGCGFEDAGFFAREGRAYCRADFARLFCPTCPGCGEAVIDGPMLTLGDEKWHGGCLTCHECGERIDGQMVVLDDPTRRYHKHCFLCDGCGCSLHDSDGKGQYALHEGRKLCAKCNIESASRPCMGCGKTIRGDEKAINALGGSWHPDCMVCLSCGDVVSGQLMAVGGRPICAGCLECTKPRCATCGDIIGGPHKVVLGHPYHADCVACIECGGSVAEGAFKRNDWLVCKEHASGDAFDGEAAERIAAFEAHAARQAEVTALIKAAQASGATQAGSGEPADGGAPPASEPAGGAAELPEANRRFDAFQDDEGDFYFVDKQSGESQWTTPEGFDFKAAGFEAPAAAAGEAAEADAGEAAAVEAEGEAGAGASSSDAGGAAEPDPNEQWDVFADEDGDLYFVNRETGESVWERPEGVTKDPEE